MKMLLAGLILVFSLQVYAERLPVEATGLWGVEGTQTTGMAIDVKEDTFAVLIFTNDKHQRQSWFIAADVSIEDPTAYALYAPDGASLKAEVGFTSFEYVGSDTIAWTWTLYDNQVANSYCTPAELVNGVCTGSDTLFRITGR